MIKRVESAVASNRVRRDLFTTYSLVGTLPYWASRMSLGDPQ